jgi:hypothetical protein
MNSFTMTAVGNLARNPELVSKGERSYTKLCLVGNAYAGKDEEGCSPAMRGWFWCPGAHPRGRGRRLRGSWRWHCTSWVWRAACGRGWRAVFPSGGRRPRSQASGRPCERTRRRWRSARCRASSSKEWFSSMT